MADGGFSEVTNESWFGRIGNAFFGILIGIVMFLGSFVLLFWNEWNYVQEAKSLAEGEKSVISVKADSVDKANEGKLIHLSDKATTDETLEDQQFKLQQPQALQLIRKVEMYQWKENVKTTKKKKLGGGRTTTKTYTYEKVWSSTPINSGKFNQNPESQGKVNPSFPFMGQTYTADKVTVGKFTLPTDLVKKIGGAKSRPITDSDYQAMPVDLQQRYQLSGDKLYSRRNVNNVSPNPMPNSNNNDPDNPNPNNPDENKNPCQVEQTEGDKQAQEQKKDEQKKEEQKKEEPKTTPPTETIGQPQIGDVKISFSVVEPQEISVVAKQTGDSFEPYKTSVGRTIEMITQGKKSATEMFEAAKGANDMMVWILRLVGWIVMGVGIYLVFNPLVVFADVVPFLGNILGAGIFIVAALVSLVLSLITIAIAWVFARPLVGIGILVVAGLLFAGFWYFSKSKAQKAKPAG